MRGEIVEMIRIITDTSTLYTPQQGKEMGIDILPLQVTVGHETYREFVNLDTDTFVKMINEGAIPKTSQPAIGEVMEAYEAYPNDQIINICMADGLSGTFHSALSCRQGLPNEDNIYVLNTRTLCGPQRYMVECAYEQVQSGVAFQDLVAMLEDKIETVRSFLLPVDFDFLKRGGRLTPIASKLGSLLKIQPVMVQTDDGCRLEKYNISRTFNGAITSVMNEFKKLDQPMDYIVYISYEGDYSRIEKISEKFTTAFPGLDVRILELSPAFITQGGPGCVAIQWIKK